MSAVHTLQSPRQPLAGRPLRLLHAIPGLEIRGGGGNRACAELCQSLAALGHRVRLYHVGDGREPCFAPAGVEVRRFPARFFHRYAYSPDLRRALAREIPQTDVVHIHALWQYPGLAAARLANRHGVPYVVQPHGSLHPWKLRHKRWRKWLYGRLVERRILAGAALVHVESEADAQDAHAYLPRLRTVISPCGVFPEAFADPGPPNYLVQRWPALAGKKCILYLARVDVNKGLDLLLEAMAGVRAQHPDAALLVVGPDFGGMTGRMQQWAHRLGIAAHVVWGGMVEDRQRVWILRQSDLYVLPSLSENFGISVLEALCCAKPVITTTATPWGWLEAAGAGRVVPPQAASLRDALLHMLALSGQVRAAMGQRGRQLALARYDWHAIAGELVQHYRAILPAGSPAAIDTESAR